MIYAWGDVPAGGGITADFGVTSVANPAAGVYVVTLNMVADPSVPSLPTPNPRITLVNGAVTATLADAKYNPGESGGCGTILVGPITTLTVGTDQYAQFIVNTFSWNLIGPSPTCSSANRPFHFHVTGRP